MSAKTLLLQPMNDALIVVQQKGRTFQGEPQDLQVKSILSVQKEDQVHDLPAESTDGSGLTTNEPSTDPEIEEALRTAGLLSDSPPNSPHQEAKGLNDEDDLSKDNRKGLDNTFEMDSHLELDIYGDFEYDLEE